MYKMYKNCNGITAVDLEEMNFDPTPIIIYNTHKCAETEKQIRERERKTQEPEPEPVHESDKNQESWFENVDDCLFECELCQIFLCSFEQLKLHIQEHKSESQCISFPNHEQDNKNNKNHSGSDDHPSKNNDSSSCSILQTMLQVNPISTSMGSSSSSTKSNLKRKSDSLHLNLNQNYNLSTLKSPEISRMELLKTSQNSSPMQSSLNRVSLQKNMIFPAPPARKNFRFQYNPAHFLQSTLNKNTQFKKINNNNKEYENALKNGLDLTTRSHFSPNSNFSVKYAQNPAARGNSEVFSPASASSPSNVFISNPSFSSVPASTPAKSCIEKISYGHVQTNWKKLKLSLPDLKTFVSDNQNHRNFACDLCFFNNSIAKQFDSMEQLDEHKREFHLIMKPYATQWA